MIRLGTVSVTNAEKVFEARRRVFELVLALGGNEETAVNLAAHVSELGRWFVAHALQPALHVDGDGQGYDRPLNTPAAAHKKRSGQVRGRRSTNKKKKKEKRV